MNVYINAQNYAIKWTSTHISLSRTFHVLQYYMWIGNDYAWCSIETIKISWWNWRRCKIMEDVYIYVRNYSVGWAFTHVSLSRTYHVLQYYMRIENDYAWCSFQMRKSKCVDEIEDLILLFKLWNHGE